MKREREGFDGDIDGPAASGKNCHSKPVEIISPHFR